MGLCTTPVQARPTPGGKAPAGTFASLRVRNYRLYFAGQAISLTGTWMQSVALSWLVFELTHSGTAIGLVLAAQFLPVLALGAYGGLIADRVAKRPLLMGTQTALASLALLLGVLSATHTIELWMVFAVAALIGTVTAVDNPTRQTFVMEIVGGGRVQNAVPQQRRYQRLAGRRAGDRGRTDRLGRRRCVLPKGSGGRGAARAAADDGSDRNARL